MAGRVEGKVAFITGAARGQGRSHAVRLAQEGADIIAIDICGPVSRNTQVEPATSDDLAETADLVKRLNRRIVTAEVDVRDYDAVKAVVDSGVEQLGRLDIVCANAGIGNGGQTLDRTSETDWTDMIDVNLSGVWKTVKAAVPHLISHGGSIILTSSVGGLKALCAHRSLHRRQARRRRSDAHLRRRTWAAFNPRQFRSSHEREHPAVHERGHHEVIPARPREPWAGRSRRRGSVHARASHRVGRTGRHQQRRAVPGVRRVAFRYRTDHDDRCWKHAEVAVDAAVQGRPQR